MTEFLLRSFSSKCDDIFETVFFVCSAIWFFACSSLSFLKLMTLLKWNSSSELQSPVKVSRISGSSALPIIVYCTSPTFSSVKMMFAL